MLVLGIETSCDETAAGIVEDGKRILSNIVASQVDFHKKFGGVVPEIASRKHLELINPVIEEALEEAKVTFKELDLIAVTCGPGLVGSLLIGLSTAKAIAYVHNLPLIGVNHLEGHIYSSFLEHPDLRFPFLSLIVSGGHTALIYVKGYDNYELLGSTRDDAAGEAYDKVAKLLNLGYPGGPIIDELAQKGNPQKINFPRAYLGKSLDFSFSGLKTAVLYYLQGSPQLGGRGLIHQARRTTDVGDIGACPPLKKSHKGDRLEDICASFQQAVVDVLIEKALRGAQKKKVKRIVLGGGVAANKTLRKELREKHPHPSLPLKGGGLRRGREKIKVYFPSPSLCTDNAAMIACAGYHLSAVRHGRGQIPAKVSSIGGGSPKATGMISSRLKGKGDSLSLDVFANLKITY